MPQSAAHAVAPSLPRDVSILIRHGELPARAWRLYLGLTLEELAARASLEV